MVKMQSRVSKTTAVIKFSVHLRHNINLMEVSELKVLSDYDPNCGLHLYTLLIFLGNLHTVAMAMAEYEFSISKL
jgi:hypothetical protein